MGRYIRRQVKRAYRSKPVQSRLNTYGRAGVQLYRDVNYLRSLVNSELHYDYASYNTTISSTGSIFHLTAIPVDNTNYGRNGNSIMPRYLQLMFTLHNSEGNMFDVVRMIVFRWKDNSTPTVADIVEDNSNPIYSPLNDNISGNTRDRQIDIIKSKWFLTGGESPSNGGVFYKKNIDLNPPSKRVKDHVKYDDTSTTAPSGGIYIMMIGTQAVNTTNFKGSHKLSFHDN